MRLHQVRRPAGWATEEDADLPALLTAAQGPVLVDCVSLWLTGVLDAARLLGRPERAGQGAVTATTSCSPRGRRPGPVRSWCRARSGWGVVPATASGRLFRDELGRLNAALAAAADEVVLVVAGLPLRLK